MFALHSFQLFNMPVHTLFQHHALFQVFDELHVREATTYTTSATGEASHDNTVLHCHNVWFAGQLPWPAEQARDAQNCLFSVIQSTTDVSPSVVYKQYKTYFM